MEGNGYRINFIDGNLLIESRPLPRQYLTLILTILVSLIVIATAAALGKTGLAAAGFIAACGVCVYLYRNLLVAVKKRMELGKDGILRWVEVKKLSPITYEKPLYDITPDDKGDKFLIKSYIHNSPGSRKLEGYPAVVWVYKSKGDGAGYRKVYSVNTMEKDVERIKDFIAEHLPDSRKE